jgi:hypothetical protein
VQTLNNLQLSRIQQEIENNQGTEMDLNNNLNNLNDNANDPDNDADDVQIIKPPFETPWLIPQKRDNSTRLPQIGKKPEKCQKLANAERTGGGR